MYCTLVPCIIGTKHASRIASAGAKLSMRHEAICKQSEIYLGCADDFSEVNIHPAVALYHVAIVCLSILQFYQLQHMRSQGCSLYAISSEGQ